MVRYTGRMKVRTGAVNTNQLGLKMSGCPSRVGRNPVNTRYIAQRVACNRGICGIPVVHEVIPWRVDMTNSGAFGRNFCQPRSTTCLAAAGGIGNINTPYYRTPAPGEGGCGVTTNTSIHLAILTLKYENLVSDAEVNDVIIPLGHPVTLNTADGKKITAVATGPAYVSKKTDGSSATNQHVAVTTKQAGKVGLFKKHEHQIVHATHSGVTATKKFFDSIGQDVENVGATVTHTAKLVGQDIDLALHDAKRIGGGMAHSAQYINNSFKKITKNITSVANAATTTMKDSVIAAHQGLYHAAIIEQHLGNQLKKVASGMQKSVEPFQSVGDDALKELGNINHDAGHVLKQIGTGIFDNAGKVRHEAQKETQKFANMYKHVKGTLSRAEKEVINTKPVQELTKVIVKDSNQVATTLANVKDGVVNGFTGIGGAFEKVAKPVATTAKKITCFFGLFC